MSHFDQEEPKDWEIRDEDPPERLKDKWAREDMFGPAQVLCPSCKKPVSRDVVTCLFCGAEIPPARERAGFFEWLKRLWNGRL